MQVIDKLAESIYMYFVATLLTIYDQNDFHMWTNIIYSCNTIHT